ncbi:unnamed protein product [marine sediment metagenome]|uniref:Ribbon-helix-helix protein CopG domain-containing protein n=1 Tax=marine sediment metagenome TaxID=412755 RepID=X1DY65_9ZZZZ|nr:MAG: hypothetical protein [uncultured archaeon]BDI55237.1 MAG: DNA-binding protein, RHH family [uncultured archaeon]
MTRLKGQIGVKLKEKTIELLDIYTKIERRNRSQTVRIILEDYLESPEVQQLIEEYNKKEKEVKK